MTRKSLIVGIAMVGLTLALGSNAWADGYGKGGKNRGNDKVYHQNTKTPPGNHNGWEKGKGNPHQDSYKSRQEYRRQERDQRWDRDRRQDHYRDRNYRDHQDRVGEKHIYHHYSSDEGYDDDDRFSVAVSVIDQVFSVVVAVSGAR